MTAGFPDAGPQSDGTRTAKQWLNAMAEDTRIIAANVQDTLQGEGEVDKPLKIALALKECRRLQSDLYRFAKEVHEIDREEIDRQGPL